MAPAPQEKAPSPPVENENNSDKNEAVIDDAEEAINIEEELVEDDEVEDDEEEKRENPATEIFDPEPGEEQTPAEIEDKAVEASQKPIQQIDFIPSWANAISRLFSP